jgi:hypothetical protein
MKKINERKYCEEQISEFYNKIKEDLGDDTLVCTHLGTFSQSMLISIVSLVERTLNMNGESNKLKKRLIYIIIECIQNIMFHSNKSSGNHQLAYIIISKNDQGYSLYSSNSLDVNHVDFLVQKLDEFLEVKVDVLSKLFTKKLANPAIEPSKTGGIGLLTMIEKSNKNFNYEVLKISDKYALFFIQINLLYKNFN